MLPTTRRNKAVSTVWDDPFQAIDREFQRMLGLSGSRRESTEALAVYPVDIHEDDNHIFIEAELPGFKKDEIDVTLEGGVLTISAERKVEQRNATQHLTERRFTRTQRSFTLPTTVDESKVDAQVKDGVLHVTLHKHEQVKPRKIQIK